MAQTSPAETTDLAGGALATSDLPSRLTDMLEDAIIHGVLKPGQRLRGDELAVHYGVSRIPVREALRALQATGWVEIRPRYGASVKQRSLDELRSLFEVRALLEAHAAGRAAEHRTKADLDALERVVTRSLEAVVRADDARLSVLGGRFYAAVRHAAHNPVLATTLSGMEKRARFYFSTVEAGMGREWVDVHSSIAAAIADRDVARARTLAGTHIEQTGEAIERLLAADDPGGRMTP